MKGKEFLGTVLVLTALIVGLGWGEQLAATIATTATGASA